MNAEDKSFIEANRQHYRTITQAGFVADLDGVVKTKMLDIIKRNFAPAYLTNLWCSPCVVDMIKYLYEQYDAMPKEEPAKEVEAPKQAELTIKKETFPKHDEPEHTVIDVPADTVIAPPVEKKKPGRKPKAK